MSGAVSPHEMGGTLDLVSIKCAETFVRCLTIQRIVGSRVEEEKEQYQIQWNNSWVCAKILKDIFHGAASLIEGFNSHGGEGQNAEVVQVTLFLRMIANMSKKNYGLITASHYNPGSGIENCKEL